MVPDLVKLIYIAEKESEVSLITDLLKQLYCDEADTHEAPSDAFKEKWAMVYETHVLYWVNLRHFSRYFLFEIKDD